MYRQCRPQLAFHISKKQCYSSSAPNTRFTKVHVGLPTSYAIDIHLSKPTVFTNYYGDLPAVMKWFKPEVMRKKQRGSGRVLNTEYLEPYGMTMVPLELTKDETFERLEAPLSLLMKHMEGKLDPSISLYLAQCSLGDLPSELQKDLPTPFLISRIGKGDIYGSSLWMGRPPTRTPLHRDPNPNLLVQLAGTKVVRLMDPEAGRKLYECVRAGRGHANIRGEEMMVGKERDMLEEAIWGDGGVEDEEVTGQEATLQGTDGLYIPLGWWHSVRGVEGTGVGVNASVSTHTKVRITRAILTVIPRSIGGSGEDHCQLCVVSFHTH
jgi:hypothetical protein